jgi:hypothetical protein
VENKLFIKPLTKPFSLQDKQYISLLDFYNSRIMPVANGDLVFDGIRIDSIDYQKKRNKLVGGLSFCFPERQDFP